VNLERFLSVIRCLDKLDERKSFSLCVLTDSAAITVGFSLTSRGFAFVRARPSLASN
jgi:hypothetical protein